VTDSGGLQEEAAWFGVPAVVLRPTTPRWEGVDAGIAAVTGPDPDRALAALGELSTDEARRRVDATPCPYGDGRTSNRIVDLLGSPDVRALLTIEEPPTALDPPPVP
jgi:UDP-N-acetylglucosamine 2-epimerase (non-hydrolysing)